MDSALLPSYESVRSWHRATLVASAVAVVEFLLLVGIGAFVFGPPLERAIAGVAHSNAARHPGHARRAAGRPRGVAPRRVVRIPPRSKMRILVLNGNGVNGAAGRAAEGLHRLGYRIAGVANAARQNYPQSLVMYAPGYRAEGMRLARDLHVRVVGPLDGIHARALAGGELAVILGR